MMRLPRPASPRALWRDIKAFAADRRPHQWIALGLALLIPASIFIGFSREVATRSEREPQVIYVESWRADRPIEEMRRGAEERGARRRAAEEERRREFQELQEKLGF